MANHWAILIGIDFYKDHPLRGAVRDVQLIQQFLFSGNLPINITTLTASTPSNYNHDHNTLNPTEDPNALPTYKIVTSHLRRIADQAAPGDFIYIHYSGHGAQTYNGTEAGNANTGDLALVLYDGVFGSRYLHGMELNFLLKRMVDKGLFVTLVLDCCFSGSVLRQYHHEDDILLRGLEYDPSIDAAYPSEVITETSNGPFRNSYLVHNWLVNPAGYTILTASGPHEKAFELKTAHGNSHGALSYFLLSTLISLRRRGASITNQSLHQHLSLIFHAEWPRQRPMRYGQRTFSFFDGLIPQPDLSFVPVAVRDGRLILGAGYAHGVHEGDEYAVYPLSASETTSDRKVSAYDQVRVIQVGGLTSILDADRIFSKVEPGIIDLKAKLLTRLSPWKASVRVTFPMEDLANWIDEANKIPTLRLSAREATEDTGDLFNVIRNQADELEICTGSGARLPSLPRIPFKSAGLLPRLLHILEHLATWKYFEGIQNRIPTPSFGRSFYLNVDPPVGQNGVLEVAEDTIISLTIQNLNDDRPLYLTIFDMGPSWQIENLISQSGGGDYKVILPRGEETINFRMSIPTTFKVVHETICEDIIKLFITNTPSPFPALELPDLSTSIARLQPSLHRGTSYDHISRFLTGLATRFRSNHTNEEWTTYNVIVRTHAAKV